jgi:hypothetical protein
MIYVNNFIECECRGESMLEIKVMTFNIHHGKGMDNRADLFRIAELIDKCDVDIVGLNEVDRHFSKRSLYEDQIGWLANQLEMDYAFSPSITIKSKHLSKIRQYGNALLSRYQKLLQKCQKPLIIYPYKQHCIIKKKALVVDNAFLTHIKTVKNASQWDRTVIRGNSLAVFSKYRLSASKYQSSFRLSVVLQIYRSSGAIFRSFGTIYRSSFRYISHQKQFFGHQHQNIGRLADLSVISTNISTVSAKISTVISIYRLS